MATFESLPDSARVWVYQSSRPLRPQEAERLNQWLEEFTEQWTSHNRQLQASADLRHNQFIILAVDESQAGASGCSIDKSVHFLKQVEAAFGIQLFDRMTFAWLEDGQVCTADSDTFSKYYGEGRIQGSTLVFNNLVKTKGELAAGWVVPLEKSWHRRMVGMARAN